MTVDVKVRKRNVFISLGEMNERTEKAIHEAMFQIGPSLVRTGENQSLNESKFGRWYSSGKTTRQNNDNHRASAAGQSPAMITGNYHDGFDYDAVGSEELIFGNSADYATFLERGTDTMDPRPGLRNAILHEARNMQTYLESSLKEGLDLES